MFEKEAEEYTENPKSAWKQGMTCVGSVRQAFKEGAEFGYNKAKEEAKEIIREYVNWDYGEHTNCLPDITKKAEQFLKENK